MSIAIKTDNRYNPFDDNVLLFRDEDIQMKHITNEAFSKLLNVINNRPKSIVVELNVYRKYVPALIKYTIQEKNLRDAAIKQTERFTTDCSDNKYKRWTDNEDKMLIELVCDDDVSMMELATTLGRTVSAIKTRLTYLVGVKRLSQKVAGKFIGEINGEQTEAELVGTVYKGEFK